MTANFLNQLPLTEQEKREVARLGADSPAALLGLILAAGSDAIRLFGAEHAQEIVRALQSLIPPGEAAVFQRTLPPRALGAQLTSSPTAPSEPPYDVEKRDRLFDQLKHLRGDENPSPDTKRRIAQLEDELNQMLD